MAYIPWGPTGKAVYERTYSRVKPDGVKETWPETVSRVADGNLALVHGKDKSKWGPEVRAEAAKLKDYMLDFRITPAGRHLWATGVEGRQYLFNCHVAGWGEKFSEHFEFTALRLFEGGGVGSNYSMRHIQKYGNPKRKQHVHILCDPKHPDYEELKPYLSKEFTWNTGDVPTVEDSREGWADALAKLLEVYHYDNWLYGENAIYDVSGIRPSGSPLKTAGGTASGPAPFAKMMLDIADVMNREQFTSLSAMEIDHAIAEAVVSGGNRRSARMAILRWDDPYIMDFIKCKQDTGKHWTTNISIEIDDEFITYCRYDGRNAANVYKAALDATLSNGEPGYWNSSLSQRGETGFVIATNPCGEISLEQWENCNLGHVNLNQFRSLDEDMLQAHYLMTRFLIRATYGDVNDAKQQAKLLLNRRIGVGHLGVQGHWAGRGVKYADIPSTSAGDELSTLYRYVRQTARDYAFELRIPEPVKVTAIAPTGTIAKLSGASEGIHPIYARYFERRVRYSRRDEEQRRQMQEFIAQGFKVEDDVYDESGQTAVVVFPTEDVMLSQVRRRGMPDAVVQSADELTIDDMLQVQALYQEFWADNAVSFTVNIPAGSMTAANLGKKLEKYFPYLKGTTIMVDESRPQAPYTRITQSEYLLATAKTVEDAVNDECSSGACPVK